MSKGSDTDLDELLEERTVQCPECQRTFVEKGSLRVHQSSMDHWPPIPDDLAVRQ